MLYRLKTIPYAYRLVLMRAAVAVGNSDLAQHIVAIAKKNYGLKAR